VVHGSLKVNANIRVGVFVDRKRCAGVLDKGMHEARLDLTDLGHGFNDRSRDQMEAT
jgi:hypothetical protein